MPAAIGLAACAVSSVFFGSMFVPIRNYNPSDGVFTQWLMSIAILIVGFLTFAYKGFPGFYPLAMLGGMSWCLGNVTAIPIISRLGMAISILIWNTTNCIMGWAGGRFGLFGMKPNVPSSPLLNYLGLVCVVIGGVLFSRVESEPLTEQSQKRRKRVSLKLEDVQDAEKAALKSEDSTEGLVDSNMDDQDEVEKIKTSSSERIFAFAAALIAGFFYGVTFVPVIHMIDNPKNFPFYPTDGLDYVFSHYFGIFITSTILFLIYAIIKKNQPYTSPDLCLPGLLSGCLWAIAQTSFFVANQHLSQAVTFPIISMMPGCIASAWSIFYYNEIKGKRNLTILATAMAITFTGAILVGLSKIVKF